MQMEKRSVIAWSWGGFDYTSQRNSLVEGIVLHPVSLVAGALGRGILVCHTSKLACLLSGHHRDGLAVC